MRLGLRGEFVSCSLGLAAFDWTFEVFDAFCRSSEPVSSLGALLLRRLSHFTVRAASSSEDRGECLAAPIPNNIFKSFVKCSTINYRMVG